jgi:NAD(P)H-hydrate epimerase
VSELDLTGRLEDLFRETGEAHHQAYIETDGADPEWPLWYAGYLQERLGTLLEARFTRSELVYLLIWVANEQPLNAPGADWARYYADFFLQRYAV